MKKGNHKETAAAADTLSLPDSGFLFLHLSSPHQNTEGFKNDNYQEGGVQLLNRKTSGSEVSKGCLAVPTSKLLCSSTLTAITANWKGKNPNLWCLESAAALMMRSPSLSEFLFCSETLTLQSFITEFLSSKRVNRISLQLVSEAQTNMEQQQQSRTRRRLTV